MAHNRKLIHCLLILSVGLMPNLSSADFQHPDHASSGCFDCNPIEMTIEISCESDSCLPAAHTCGANFCPGFIPENAASIGKQLSRLVKNLPGKIIFRSHLAESIYRPPIS
jgi:hypothetical protein